MKLLLLMALLPLCLFVNPNAYAQEIDPQEEAEYLQSLYQQHPDISREEAKRKAQDFRAQNISEYWQQVAREDNRTPAKSFRQPALRSVASPVARTSHDSPGSALNAASAEGEVPDAVEYAALKALYDSLDGDGWLNNNGWLQGQTSADFAQWSGVSVNGGDVTQVSLLNNRIRGTIPAQIGELKGLQELLLYDDLRRDGDKGYLEGTIPGEIGQLTRLKRLVLGGSYYQGEGPYTGDRGLSGTLPTEMGNLAALEFLYIIYTQLSDGFPVTFEKLTNLEEVFLIRNALAGEIPSHLSSLSKLRTLHLNGNRFTSISPAISTLPNLQSLDISGNAFSGTLPTWLGSIASLRTLNLAFNSFSGALPGSLGQLGNLQNLTLHYNEFSGPVPTSFEQLSSLTFLNLSDNQLLGELPVALSTSSALNGLYLYKNAFTFQTIEPFFTGVNTSRVANFRYTPQDTVKLAEIDPLVEGDALTLSFPTTAQQNQYAWQKKVGGEWQALEEATQQEYTISNVTLADSGKYRCVVTNQWATELTLYTHPVAVTVTPKAMDPETEALHEFLGATADLDQWPDSWKTSAPIATWEGVSTENARVTAIKLTDKNIDSEIPESFGNLTELRKLELAGNRLRGPIPQSLGRLQKLEVLDLQRNRLTGPIPREVGQMRNLRELNLQKNQLTGSIPPSVGQLKKVHNLRLNSNQLSGTLPPEVGDMTNLRQLFVNKNKLTGPIPSSIGRLSDLRGLHLEDNQFSGPIPAALGNPPRLEQLYLHKNRLSGPVPASFGKLSRVKTLSLHQNRLEGRIPNTWVNMRNLEELNISNNNFTYLPDFSRHPRVFRRFDVRRNRLTFESLLPHRRFAPFRYDPQKPVGVPRIIDINDCNPLSLDYNVDLNIRNNRYDWYRRNELWIDTSYPSIRLDIPTRHYSGSDRLLEYYARVSNPAFPGFYLRTQPITLRNNLTQTCNTATASSEPYNYVKTETVLRRGKKTAVSLEHLSKSAKETHYDYIDGLGRVMQQVDVHGSPSGKSIVQPIEYDPLGRVAKLYLPYAANTASSNYRTDAIQQAASFYQADDDKIANTDHPYAETIYEASPLGRVSEQGAVGEVWQPTTPGDDDNKTIKYEHRTNRAREVRWWKLQDDGISSNYFRQPGQLYVAETRDEDNRKVITFTDKRGLLLQKQVEGDDGETLQTHYIYDDFGNLRVVIPPKAVAALYSNGYDSFSFTSDFIREGCYLYEYDERQRMISQQVPGANPVEMVYDAGDRLVLTQDGNQRKKGQWSFTKYDHLNRPIINGLINNSSDRAGMQSSRKNKHSVERYIGTQDNAHVNHFGYSNQSYPDTDNASVEVLAVTYYDNYRFTEDLTWGGGYRFSDVSLQGDHPASYPTEYFPRVQGLVTATQTRVLGTDDWLYGAVYYDDEYRPIQTNSSLYPGGGEVVTSQYDFVGRILHTLRIHQGADAGQGFEEHYRYVYDHAGRATKVYHRLTNGGEVLLASYAYNELGEVIEKNLHQLSEDDEPLQSLDYRYNERGWLQRINHQYLGSFGEEDNDRFGISLDYDALGHISNIGWTNQTDAELVQSYEYGYDGLDRLSHATYHAGSDAGVLTGLYDVVGANDKDIAYDLNGNLLSLSRYNGFEPMDVLTYDYGTGVGNQLHSVTDKGTAEGFTPGEGGLEADYYYDENGNLTDDYHKGTTTTYNHLNLPEKISTATGDEIRYTYDAAGTKLMQEVVQDGITQRTVYQNGVEYRSLNYTPGSQTVLAHIMTPEGRVLPLVEIDNTPECEPVYFPDPQNWTYHYDIKDHLGNVRVTLSNRRITDTYLATMESERADSEEALFGNINEDIREQDVLYNTTGECDAIELPDEMAHLNAVVGKITGPTKSLMVQNGDVVRLEVQAQYRDNTESNETAMGSILPSLLSALGIPTGGDGAAQVAYQAFDALFGAKVLLAKDNTDPVPYAYLYYQLFDINFRPVPSVAGMIGVSEAAATGPELLESNDINISKRGFLYVWLSNESQWDVDVFFDDFRVAHEHSEIIQAQDYYPFGGPIQRFAGYQSKYLFQSKEWQTALGLNLFDFHARQYDPWLGRFSGIDPQNQFASGYVGMGNDPVNMVDPDGRFAHLIAGAVIGGAFNLATNWNNIGSFGEGLGYFGVGAVGGALAAGVGAGMSATFAGGSFGAGFLGTTGASATGFIAGSATGASAGLANGLVQGAGNRLLRGNNFGDALGAGMEQGWQQGAIGGVTGGISGGLDALSKNVNFFTGEGKFSLSSGYGAHGIKDKNQTIKGNYVGEFEGINVYESTSLGIGYGSGGLALPERGIFVGKGAFSKNLDPFLVKHEFGHILQAREIGIDNFYLRVAPHSVVSGASDPYNHNYFWTEKWANRLSLGYFKDGPNWPYLRFPVDSISPELLRQLKQPRLFNPYGF